MPTYSCRCNQCGRRDTFISKVDDRNNTPTCCDAPTERLLDTPMVGAQTWTGHKAVQMTDGTWIESGASYEKYLKQNNKIPASEGQREAEIQQANKLATDEKKLDAAVERAVLTHTN